MLGFKFGERSSILNQCLYEWMILSVGKAISWNPAAVAFHHISNGNCLGTMLSEYAHDSPFQFGSLAPQLESKRNQRSYRGSCHGAGNSAQ